MAKVLSQNEIDALLNSASAGEPIDAGTDNQQQKVSLYDFKHPNLISKEQMRLLENIHEGIVRNLGVFLSAQLRMIVDMSLLTIDQIMYSEFVMSINSPAATYVGMINSPHSQFVLEISPQLVIFIVERLFGGYGSFDHPVRPISVIERKVMKRVVDRIAQEVSKNWKDVHELSCEFSRFEGNPEFVQIVPASEPVIVVSMEISIRGSSSMINLCYPYMWISNVISTPDVQEKIMFGSRDVSEEDIATVSDCLNLTSVDLKTVLGSNNLTVKDLMNLEKGDVIRLDTSILKSVPIYIKNKHVFNGSIGTRDRQYAIRIESKEKGVGNDKS
jgi:flagellar motor switch protein FliM